MSDRLTSPPRTARFATFLIFCLNGFGLGMWLVHLPNVEHNIGVPHSVLGLLLLVLGGAALIGMQVVGPLVDRIGPRRLTPAAAAAFGLSLTVPGWLTSWWSLGLILIVMGFANGALDVSMNAHAVVVERGYDRPIMAAFHAMWSIGGAFAALIGAVVLNANVPTGLTMTITGLFVAALSLVALRFTIDADHHGRTEETVDTEAKPAPPKSLVWILGGLALALMLAEGVANDWAALELKGILNASASEAALGYGAFAVAMTIGRFATDRVAAAIGATRVVRYGAAIAAIGLTVASVSPWIPLALVGWALFGIGLAGGVPQLFTAAGNLDHRSAGALMARVVGLGYVGLLAGPAVIGGLTRLMPLNVAFALPIILCVLTVVFASALNPREEKELVGQRPMRNV
ncbi:MFS transporter [Kutzneria sp. CA-103260]|uniref:MFS transporter n=1 Tax=Kutzneria sp. CA-103260 TaxID=2802641 RepID=UPI001BAAF61B|nr:MFS transporter [Kutzneria sp. CA-103260]QUQ63134.1 major facilitator superfamily transporter [Kutzneria sp. CA-103260]